MNELIEIITLTQGFAKAHNGKADIEFGFNNEGELKLIELSYMKDAINLEWDVKIFSSTEKAIAGIKALIELKKATA